MCNDSVFLDHYFSGLNDCENGVSLFEFQLVGAAPSDGAFYEIVADPHHDVGHDVAQFDFFNCSAELVSG